MGTTTRNHQLHSMMGSILTKSAALDFGIQWGLFAIAAALKTEKFYDLAGSSTFLLLAYQSLQWGHTFYTRQKIQTGAVAIWASRLGLFLFNRILQDGQDTRFEKIRGDPKRFFIAWTLQGMWVFLTLLPTLILNGKREDKPLATRDYVGWGMWATGFLFEVLADYQKSQFKADPANKGQFIRSGLWGISRHPNYFGEILAWSGLFLSASSVMHGWEHLSIVSPLFVTFLLTKVSGIPMLEKAGLKRWGTDPAYQQYLKSTAVLIPYLW